jgi:hypothetical protein
MAKMKIEAAPRARARAASREGPAHRHHAALGALRRDARRWPNARDLVPGLPRLAERAAGFAAERPLPRFRRDAFRDDELPRAGRAGGRGHPLPDLFNRYFEPENLRAALRVSRRRATTRRGAARRGAAAARQRAHLPGGRHGGGSAGGERGGRSALLALRLAGGRPRASRLLTLRDEFLVAAAGRGGGAAGGAGELLRVSARRSRALASSRARRRRTPRHIATRRASGLPAAVRAAGSRSG